LIIIINKYREESRMMWMKFSCWSSHVVWLVAIMLDGWTCSIVFNL